jgi:hypothetical protein
MHQGRNSQATYPWTAAAALGVLLLHILGVDDADTTVWLLRTAGHNALVKDLILKAVNGKFEARFRGQLSRASFPKAKSQHNNPSTKEARECFVVESYWIRLTETRETKIEGPENSYMSE